MPKSSSRDNQSQNGENHPLDAPLMHIDGDLNDPTQKAQRVYTIFSMVSVERGTWTSYGVAPPVLQIISSTLMGITDPTIADTDDDE